MSPALCFLFFRTLGGGACLCKSASVPLRKVAADRIRALGEHRKGWPCLPASEGGLAGMRALRFAYLLSLRVGSCGPSVTHWPVLASHISSSPEPSELPWHSPCLPKPRETQREQMRGECLRGLENTDLKILENASCMLSGWSSWLPSKTVAHACNRTA